MSKNNNPTTKFQVDISELKAGITEANRQIRLANSEFKSASSGMDDWKNSADGLTAKLKQLQTVQDAENKKLQALKQQYASVVAEQGENSKSAQELAIKINNQQAQVNKVTKEIGEYNTKLTELKSDSNSAESSVKGLGNATKTAGDKADDSSDGYTVLKDVIADLATKVLTSAIEGFKNLAIEGEDALDKLQASTGATNDEMEKYKDKLNELYSNNYGESLQDLGDKFAYIKQVTGETDPSKLAELTKNAIGLEDTFGSDFNETVRGVQNLMTHFGLSSQEAFDLFAKGSQEGLDYTDELGDNVAEYGGNFAQAGYSANEYFQLLKNGADGGAYNLDKVNDSINEVKSKLGDGTIEKNLDIFSNGTETAFKNWQKGKGTMKDVIDSIVGDISNCTSETDALTMAQVAFGTKGEDANLDVVKALTTTGDTFSDVKGTMEDVDTTRYDNLGSAISGLGRTLKTEILQPIVDTIAPVITNFINWILKNLPIVKPIIIGLAVALGVLAGALAIQGLIAGVSKALAFLNTTLLANPITWVVAGIMALVAVFIYLWKKSDAFRKFWIGLWKIIKNVASTAWKAISGFFKSAWTTIQAVWNTAKPYFLAIWSAIKSIFSVAKTVLGGFFKGAWNAIKLIFAVAGAYFQTVWNVIKGIFSVVKSVLSGNFGDAWKAIKKIFATVGSFFRGVWSKIKAPFASVASWFKGIFQSAYNGIKSVFGKLGSFFRGVWTTITGIFKKVGTTVGNAISGSVKSAINSVLSGAVRIINGFISAINFAIKWINKIPGVNIQKLSKLDVPKLAKGGVVDGATLAMIGENGKEAVVPLENNTGWIRGIASDLVKELGSDGSGIGGGNVTNNYNFNQTNNSPKSLSRLEIYRQTKNQFQLIKGVR